MSFKNFYPFQSKASEYFSKVFSVFVINDFLLY